MLLWGDASCFVAGAGGDAEGDDPEVPGAEDEDPDEEVPGDRKQGEPVVAGKGADAEASDASFIFCYVRASMHNFVVVLCSHLVIYACTTMLRVMCSSCLNMASAFMHIAFGARIAVAISEQIVMCDVQSL